ncbi:MAG: hypothetical protein M3O36_04065 [Myxococcota bacterium]|nr:hypothetical protein [Myxococcota bacterium]
MVRAGRGLFAFFVLTCAAACDVRLLQSGVPDASADGADDASALPDARGSLLADAGVDASVPARDASRDTGAPVRCVGGVCSTDCPPNRAACGADCVDLGTDKNHCGSCARSCTVACASGVCAGPVALAAGLQHSCALLPGGAVNCWGSNTNGQLGNGVDVVAATPPVPRPVAVSTLDAATAVAAGQDFACALVSRGAVVCWGVNAEGELGNGTGTNSSTPVAVASLSGVTALSAGYQHACAITLAGGVRCWGSNVAGELGDGTSNTSYIPVAVPALSGAIALATGWHHTCAVLSGGSVECWGDNTQGQLGSGSAAFNATAPVAVPGLGGVTAIAAGQQFTCALLADGTLRCWGENLFGQLGDGTATKSSTPVLVSGVSGAIGLVAGSAHTCALLQNGTVSCWGLNGEGQLGNGMMANSLLPVPVANLSHALGVAAGQFHTCARSSGDVQCWGSNRSAQLGNGSTTSSAIPVAVVW